MPCALLTDEPLTLRNLPRLADVDSFGHLLNELGVSTSIEGTRKGEFGRVMTFRAANIASTVAPYDIVRKMRASILVLGPLLARAGEATVSLPGGCAIGNRPIDLHLKALQALGAEIEIAAGYVKAIWFGVVFLAAFGTALRLTGVRRPWLWAVVVTASPVIAYPLSTGGDDLPVLALICLGLALLRPAALPLTALADGAAPDRTGGLTTQRIILASLALGLAAAMKATAWPALAVALALVAARCGRRAAALLVLVTLCVPLAVDGPVLFAQPSAVVSNTILFPLGLTKVQSPAATPLPGHLMAEAWPWGHYAAIGLLLLSGLAIAAWLVLSPPRDERAAGLAAGPRDHPDVRVRPGQPVRLHRLPARPGRLAAAQQPPVAG